MAQRANSRERGPPPLMPISFLKSSCCNRHLRSAACLIVKLICSLRLRCCILALAFQRARILHPFFLTAWVFLPDHRHAICAPVYPLIISVVMKSIPLCRTSSLILVNRRREASSELWQERFFDAPIQEPESDRSRPLGIVKRKSRGPQMPITARRLQKGDRHQRRRSALPGVGWTVV